MCSLYSFNILAGLLMSVMRYLCRHYSSAGRISLCLDDFDKHWWLLQPPKIVHTQNVVDLPKAWDKMSTEYSNAAGNRKREIVEHVLALPDDMRDNERIKSQGRPVGALNCRSGSTERDLSLFEHAEVTLNPPKRRKCSNCSEFGHTF